MLTGLAGAAVSAIGGLASNYMNAKYNAQEAQKNRDFQMQMYKQQYDDSIKFWNMQNEYNLPSAKAKHKCPETWASYCHCQT